MVVYFIQSFLEKRMIQSYRGGDDMFGENNFMEKGFYERLAQLRRKKGVTARDMSLAIGQNKGYINSIESGRNYPLMSTFFYICDYLGVTPAEFFDTENNNPERISALVEKLKTLNDEQLKLIETMVNQMKS